MLETTAWQVYDTNLEGAHSVKDCIYSFLSTYEAASLF
jgi:hypothetical protein